jgi:hypothetical protein
LRKRIPPDIRDKVTLTFEFRDNSVTLFENRPRWNEPSQWTHSAIAQFRFEPSTGNWTLYCVDRNSKWHIYQGLESTKRFDVLLNEVDHDPTGIFFG